MSYTISIALGIWLLIVHLRLNQQENEIHKLRDRLKMLDEYLFGQIGQNRTANDNAPNNNVQYPAEQNNIQQPHALQQKVVVPQRQQYPYQPPKAQPKIIEPGTADPNKENKEKNSVENILGKNIIGIAASGLIFIGLIFLGVLVYDYISEAVKIIFMYAFSVSITALGLYLTLKKRNNFNIILTGCGCGSIFISILLTHIYFGRINDLTAFSLIAVWMALTFLLAKKTDSVLLSIITHIGMTISVCFSLTLGINDEKLAIVLIYQVISTVIIVGGNILCSKKTYNLGLIVSAALSVIASMRMISAFTVPVFALAEAETSISRTTILAVFIFQFIGTSFLSYLLSVSANKMKNDNLSPILHFVNKILWSISLAVNITFAFYRLIYRYLSAGDEVKFHAILIAVCVSIGIMIIHAVITVLMSYKLNFKDSLENISVSVLAAVTAIELFILWIFSLGSQKYSMYIIGYIVLAAIFMIMGKCFRNKVYSGISKAFLYFDFVFTLFAGYRMMVRDTGIVIPFIYMLLYLAYIWIDWLIAPEEKRDGKINVSKIMSFAAVEISVFAILIMSNIAEKGFVILTVLTVLNLILYVTKFDLNQGKKTAFSYLLCVNEYFLVIINLLLIAFVRRTESNEIILLILTMAAGLLAFSQILNVIRKNSNIFEEAMTGFKLTAFTLSVIRGNSVILDEAYIFSLICMVTALICIVTGFIFNIKSMRLYGLALTLICVMKLVTFDVSDQSTILRVISLIGGGIICFIISAIYNYYEKHTKLSQ